MKTETIQVVTKEAFMEHLLGKVEGNHKVSKTGSTRGGIKATANLYGIAPQELSNVINGFQKPTPRILKHEKLQPITVYVPIKESN